MVGGYEGMRVGGNAKIPRYLMFYLLHTIRERRHSVLSVTEPLPPDQALDRLSRSNRSVMLWAGHCPAFVHLVRT